MRTSDPLLSEMAGHLIGAGGKRLRPLMSVLSALSSVSVASDEVVLGGVACELVQVGSLYHDDVMDEAEMRRGVQSVNARWGNHRAILAGDFLLARSSEIAASLGAEVAGLLGFTIGRLVEGQIGELSTQYSVDRTVDQYLSSIGGKTASLFAAATRIGAIVAGLPRPEVEALTVYGDCFGVVFQIVDDILDIVSSEEKLGKPAGHDMVEGVFTLPVLLTLQEPGPHAGELRDLLSGGEGALSPAETDKALALVRSGEGIAGARNLARGYAERAARAVEHTVGAPVGKALHEACDLLLASVY